MITVIAGVNGAGKSTVFGANLRDRGGEYYNPDEITRELMTGDPTLSQSDANSQAWTKGYRQLVNAINLDTDYTLETTLGGNTITQCLLDAMQRGVQVQIFYCGLTSPELHIERVRERVALGGHDIPEEKIRDRFVRSAYNVMRLIPGCHQLVVLDNSETGPEGRPAVKRLFSVKSGKVTVHVGDMPEWARPLAATALTHFSPASR